MKQRLKNLDIVTYFQKIRANSALVWSLAKNDFKTRYAGSYLGIVWAFIQPIITVCVYWFVFTVGMGMGDMEGVPYSLWLLSGLVPWFYFSDGLTGGTNAMLEYSYLVKKVVFDIDILPFVKMLSATFIHSFFLLFTVILFIITGHPYNIHYLQLLYYSFCVFMLNLSLSYITCAVVIFFRDLSQIIGIILQIGVWLTPILWQLDMIKGGLKYIFYLNPIYYIVLGYRDSLIHRAGLFGRWQLAIYFWVVVLVLFFLGRKLFRRLQVHFADVL